MKTISLQSFQLIFVQSKRLLLLLLLLLFVVVVEGASNSYRYAKVEVKIHPQSTGSGKVYVDGANVDLNGEATEKGVSATAVGRSSNETSGETDISFNLKADAKAQDNSYFAGWTTNNESLEVEKTENPYQFIVKSSETNSDPNVSDTWYGLFKNIITISPNTTDVVLIKGASGISPAKYNLTVYNGELFYSIARGENSKFSVDKTDKGSGSYELQISAKSSATVSDTETITLTGGGATVVLSVSIQETPIITLNPGENGTYTYYQPGLGVAPDAAIKVTETSNIEINQSEGFSFVLTPTANSDYRFDRWRIENGESVRYSFQQTFDGMLNKNDVVTPEFIEVKYAQFILVGETPQVCYNHLEDAIAKAQTSAYKTIAVYNSGWLLSGNYLIPEGITLLVPGDDNYTCRTSSEGLLNEDYVKTSAGTLKKKLTLSDNTTITVKGNICIYAKLRLITAGLVGVRPDSYGQLEMGDNCHIILESTSAIKAGLFVYGYITNRDDKFRENCTITAKNNSIVYEQFLVTDYRGGQGTTKLIGNSNGVFPMCQYFVNSIEPKLIFEYGAEEWLTTGMDLNGSMIANSVFIVPNTSAYTNGFIRIGEGTKVTKYYDATTDRQKFIIQGNNKNTEVQLANIALELGGYNVNSADYVLPLTLNMDVECKSVKVTIKEELAVLAGASVRIDADAEVVVASDARLFVYDRMQHDVYQSVTKHDNLKLGWYNYFGAGNSYVNPLTYRIGNKTQKYNRETNDFKVNSAELNSEHYHANAAGTANVYTALPNNSATIIVNGKLSGPIYTTEGGACIKSEEGGEVTYTTTTTTSLHQALQYVNDIKIQYIVYNSIGNTVAKLYNADGSYSAGTDVKEGDTYIYYPNLENEDGSKGRWSLPIDGISSTSVPELKITLPTQSSISGEVVCTLTRVEGTADYEPGDFTVTCSNSQFELGTKKIEDGKLIIPITYKKQHKHGEYTYSDVLMIKNAAIGLEEKVSLTAIEDYKPKFSATASVSFSSNVLVPQSKPLDIHLEENNVTTIWNDATYGERLKWEPIISGENAGDFTFKWGEGENKLSDAQVVFDPKTEGQNKSATFTLTAIYEDANETSDLQYSINIPLSGTATLNPNTLKFATPPAEIFEDSEAFSLFVVGSDNAKAPITITIDPASTGEVELSDTGENTKIKPKVAGTVKINVTQPASESVAGFAKSLEFTIKPEVLELTQLTVCVDELKKFKAHTNKVKSVAFDDKNDKVTFTSTATDNSQWTLIYEGVADKIAFIPNGSNQWLVEQATSVENNDWTTVSSWQFYESGKSVECSLKPTTTAIRITYAQGENVGTLTNVCISKLNVTANLQKMYLPVNTDDTESSATIVFTHTDKNILFSEIAELVLKPTTSDNLGSTEYPYYATTLQVKPNSSTVIDKVYSLIATTAFGSKEVQIRTYANPQELPIKLATDNPERYNFITIASANAQWNATKRQVVFQNTTLDRSVTFSFHGAPSVVKFDLYNTLEEEVNVVGGDWVIEGYDGEKWNVANEGNRVVEGNTFEQAVKYNWQQIRITYKSTNATEVRIANLVIEGYPDLIAPEIMTFSAGNPEKQLTLTAINLNNITIKSDNGDKFKLIYDPEVGKTVEIKANSELFSNALGVNLVGDITLTVVWEAQNSVDEGTITITNDDQNGEELAVIKLLGAQNYIFKENATETGVFTGLASDYTLHGAEFTEYTRHEVDLTNTFSVDGKPLFDCLIVYGETTTTDGTTNVTIPNSQEGSNAKTPYYIYVRNNEYNCYQFVESVENANVPDKAFVSSITSRDSESAIYIDVPGELRIYMTGFCPYATTGYAKQDEGVWFFRGESGEKLDLYLEDCFIFSRNKTEGGHSFRDRNDVTSPAFTGKYVRGSGAVFAFENTTYHETQDLPPFDVNIHTRGTNVFKSTHGCFFQLIEGLRAFQVSSPIQVHMASDRHLRSKASKTSLTFDDLWPIAAVVTEEGEGGEKTVVTTYENERTNGFISLQKQTNNAPSIDLGSPSTEVNFKGGRVELQNAQIVSTNYKTTLAISYRSGEMGGDDVGFRMAYGIGTDSVGGTVNFYDGTITVIPMKVAPEYSQFYLMDEDNPNTPENEAEYTSCLRCPAQTYVYGGSICRIRACMHVTSKGGAPTDGPDENAQPLGQYVYSAEQGYIYRCDESTKPECKLVALTEFPNGRLFNGLPGYYSTRPYGKYGIESITPDEEGNVYLWIPDGYAGVDAEEDKLLKTWKACMTEISAGIEGLKGTVGGETYIDRNEEVKYMLYCEIDDEIHNVIVRKDAEDKYLYNAPVKVPSPLDKTFGTYMEIPPMYVGEELQNEVVVDEDYTIKEKVWYVTTATADIWKTFTAPFNVKKIYVVETYSEAALNKIENPTRSNILKEQAKHNADFAAFFGVAMAIGTNDSFEKIFEGFRDWGKMKDQGLGLYNPETDGEYTLRDMYELTPYVVNPETNKGNWDEANFYLNENKGNWRLIGSEDFDVKWSALSLADLDDGILLHKGSTYSMMLPYCTGCETSLDARDYWDYWSGKFLIFEGVDGEQTINGRNFLNNIFSNSPADGEVVVTGNSTFAFMDVAGSGVYVYNDNFPALNAEYFMSLYEDESELVLPTTSFLYGEVPVNENGASVLSISRMGKIKYRTGDNNGDDTPTGGEHVPTVGGGSDIFVTSVAEGINISVSEPQYVGVFSATGALLYNGWVETSVDVNLVVNGVYVVVGENNSVKVIY